MGTAVSRKRSSTVRQETQRAQTSRRPDSTTPTSTTMSHPPTPFSFGLPPPSAQNRPQTPPTPTWSPNMSTPRPQYSDGRTTTTPSSGRSQGAPCFGFRPAYSIRSPPPTTRECSICCISKKGNDMVCATTECTHPPHHCSLCLQRYVDKNIRSSLFVTLKCPTSNCRKTLSYTDIERCASPSVFFTYDRQLLRRHLNAIPDFRWCKNSACSAGQEHTGADDNPIVRCHACGTRGCYTHDSPWHEGMTCDQYTSHLDSLGEESATHSTIAATTKPCPRCGVHIEKTEGCEHMTCRLPAGCGLEFCWLCMADYTQIWRDGNHHHRTACRFHTPYPMAG